MESLPQDERWRDKVTVLHKTKDFTKFNIEEPIGSIMTHELHLGAAEDDVAKNKSITLKVDDQDDLELEEDDSFVG